MINASEGLSGIGDNTVGSLKKKNAIHDTCSWHFEVLCDGLHVFACSGDVWCELQAQKMSQRTIGNIGFIVLNCDVLHSIGSSYENTSGLVE